MNLPLYKEGTWGLFEGALCDCLVGLGNYSKAIFMRTFVSEASCVISSKSDGAVFTTQSYKLDTIAFIFTEHLITK